MVTDKFSRGEMSAEQFERDLDGFDEFFQTFEGRIDAMQSPDEFPEGRDLQAYARETLDEFREAVACLRRFLAHGDEAELSTAITLTTGAHSRMEQLGDTARSFAQNQDFFLA